MDEGRVQGRIVAALDGVEVLSSYSRCCDSCVERRVSSRQGGVKVEQVQYYHRAVGLPNCQQPGQALSGHRVAATQRGRGHRRLALAPPHPRTLRQPFLRHPPARCSLRPGPRLATGEKIGWDLVISLKQNQRDLYQSAVRLFAHCPADSSCTEQHDGKTYQAQLWDTPELPFSDSYPQPVRVVRSEETVTQNHYRQRPTATGNHDSGMALGDHPGPASLSRPARAPTRPCALETGEQRVE